MKTKPLFFCAFFPLLSYISFSQTITINIISPAPNQTMVDTILNVVVQASSTAYEISNVTASVQGRQTQLLYVSGNSNYQGTISLSGLPQNSAQILQVVATAGPTEQKTASVTFINNYDPPPVLVVDSLLDGSNANPQIHIKAAAADNNTDSINIRIYPDSRFNLPYFNQNFHNPVDSIFNLTAFEGNYGYMVFTATDSSGKTARDTAIISIESSPFLQRIFSADKYIIDFNFNKVLTYDKGNQKIIDITTGESRVIPYTIRSSDILPAQGQSLLTPNGAIFKEAAYGAPSDSVSILDWNMDSLYFLGQSSAYYPVKVAGNFATWSHDKNLYLRDLQNRTNKVISTYYGSGADVAEDGNMAFTNYDYNLLRYVNNIAGLLTSDGDGNFNINPLTDGTNIVFSKVQRKNYGSTIASVYLWNGQSLSELSNFDRPQPGYGPAPYQVNNKWIAYGKKGPTGIIQIMLRDSSGINAQRTFFNADSYIDFLGPQGDFTGIKGGRRFFAKMTSNQFVDFASTLGKIYYRDSSWYVVLGRSIYKIATTILTAPYVTVADGLWSNPATWTNNIVPPAGADIFIRTNVTADINITCNSLTVQPPGSITVNTGVVVTILK